MNSRNRYCFLLLVMFGLVAHIADARETPKKTPIVPSSVQRDPEAIAVVQKAILALGGAANLTASDSFEISGEVVPSPDGSASAGSFAIKVSGKEYRFETPVGTEKFILASNHGKPRILRKNKAISAGQLHLSSFAIPLIGPTLARRFLSSSLSFIFKGYVTEGDGAAAVTAARVRIQAQYDEPLLTELTRQDWYFDARSGLPIRVEYNDPARENGAITVPVAIDVYDYRAVSGMRAPYEWKSTVDGKVQSVSKVTLLQAGASFSPTDFEITEGASR